MPKVTGIGGVFFKSRNDPKALSDWYAKYLGLTFEPWGGAILRWTEDRQVDGGATVWSTAKPDTQWFSPSESAFMINYRVEDLDGMLARFRADGIEILQGPDADDNGTFAWVLDPDGNKVELWEPKKMADADEKA